MNTNKSQTDLHAAVLFTHQFATLINAGVSLVRTLLILEAEAPSPYAEAMPTVRERIEADQTLSQAISDLPALFPPFYRCMIRAGEVGGVLDITLARTANLLQEELTLSQNGVTGSFLLAGGNEHTDWDLLSPSQRTLHLLLFCGAWGMMLTSGVPILEAMEVAAESLPTRQRAEVLAAGEVIKVMKNSDPADDFVPRMTFLPLSARTLISVGAECGMLDTSLLKAAELYRHLLNYQRLAG